MLTRLAPRHILIAAALLVMPRAIRNVHRGVEAGTGAAFRIATLTPEARRVETYGDCSGRGYGYVSRVLRNYPEPDRLPLLVHAEGPRYLETLLPGARRVPDDRVLLGLGVPTEVAARSGYVVVQSDSGCFTAVRPALLAQADRPGPWRLWLRDLARASER